MTLIAAALLLAGTLLSAAAVIVYTDNAKHDADPETMRIARAVAVHARRAFYSGIAGWVSGGNTTGPLLLVLLLGAFLIVLFTYSTAPGKLTHNGRPVA